MVPEWFAYANCMGLPRDVFFSEDAGDQDSAIRICGRCEVKAQCLAYAFEAEATIKEGIFGGTTGAERTKYAQENGIKPTHTNRQLMQALTEEVADATEDEFMSMYGEY